MQTKLPISPKRDPWDVWHTKSQTGHYQLTSVEFTTTNLCNLRCQHCAVGELLVDREGSPLSTDLLIQRLEEIPELQTISITGGEPILNQRIVNQTIRPLLKYAKQRGIYTQLNSNLTLPLSRYTEWIDDLDVLHISYNYTDVHDFYRMAFHHQHREVSLSAAEKLFQQMIDNAKALTKQGVFVSAESFLSPFTAKHLSTIHQQIIDMGCQRHEVHPLYPSDFAQNMQLLTLDEYRQAVNTLLDVRDPDVWMLFGTLPFFPCSDNAADHRLWQRLAQTKNVTVRQDPDGRNRLNVNAFSGDVIVTDFGDLPPLGNIKQDSLTAVFERWLDHPLAKSHHCYCPAAQCTGPNLLVRDTYYPRWDFLNRKAKISIKKDDAS